MVLVLERLLEVHDALKQMMSSQKWKDWKERQDRATRRTADTLEETVYNTTPGGFFSKIKQVVHVLGPVLTLVRELEHDKPNIHMVWWLVSQASTVLI